MGEQHALRVARGAGRVAQRRGCPLVEVGPFVVVILRADQVLVAEEFRDRGRRQILARGHRDEPLDRLELRSELRDQRREREIEEKIAVCRVIGDVFDLLGEEARVDRVQHGADAGDAEVELHVAIAVPRERGNAIAGSHAENPERLGKLLRAAMNVGVRTTMERTLDRARDDLAARMKPVRVLDQRRDQQRAILYQSFEHGRGPGVAQASQKYRLSRPARNSNRRP